VKNAAGPALNHHLPHSTTGAGAYRGYVYIAVAAVCWGISASLGRAAFTRHLLAPGSGIDRVSPVVLSQARTSFSFVAVLIGLLASRGGRKLQLPWVDLARLGMLGLAGVAASNYFYYLAIQRTNVATAIILQYTAPVWVLLFMVLRGKERPTLSKMISVALALCGIGLVIGLFRSGGFQLDPIGVIAALVAAFSFAYYNIDGHSLLITHDRWIVLLYTTFSASLFWLAVNPPNRIVAAHFKAVVWLFLIGFAMISVLIPFVFYFSGLQRLRPTNAIIASCLEPVFTILVAAFALKEIVQPLQAGGILMVLGAILLVQRPSRGGEVQPVAGPVD
jgi:drug/metabolite transporter, DME family